MTEPTPEIGKKATSLENALELTVTKEAVIESLRLAPENLTILNAYIDIHQKQIQAPYVSREDTEKLTFKFLVDLAEIYRDAGLTEAAVDAYNDAADMAQANGMEEKYNAILAEIAKL